MSIHVRFGASDEEGSGQVQHMEPGEIDIAPIHDVYCARLREQQVERVNVMQFAIRHVDEARDVAAQVKKGFIFTAGLGVRELAPRKTGRQKTIGGQSERLTRVAEA